MTLNVKFCLAQTMGPGELESSLQAIVMNEGSSLLQNYISYYSPTTANLNLAKPWALAALMYRDVVNANHHR